MPNSPCALKYASNAAISSAVRPVPLKYSTVLASTGKKPIVAPYSGAMLAMVARSGTARVSAPSPKNSTNLPTTFSRRRISVTVSTRSVAVTPSRSRPLSLKPTTSGVRKYCGWPSIPASASMPPTPQPTTPMPLIIVVWLSVPTSVSG